MKMSKIKEIAKKKRARLLRQQEKTGFNNTEMAALHGVTTSRMWLQLKKAKEEKAQG